MLIKTSLSKFFIYCFENHSIFTISNFDGLLLNLEGSNFCINSSCVISSLASALVHPNNARKLKIPSGE